METTLDIITLEQALEMLRTDPRVNRFGSAGRITTNGRFWVTLRKGYTWRISSPTDEFGYDYKPIRYFKNAIATARALGQILTDAQADEECAIAAWEYRTWSSNR